MTLAISIRCSSGGTPRCTPHHAALLGYACHSMPEPYASPDITGLTLLANRDLERIQTVTVLRVVNS